MSRSSGRAQVEPLVALAAVLAAAVGMTLYAGVVDGYLDSTERRSAVESTTHLTQQAADRVAGGARVDGSLRPERLAAGADAGPAGYRVNATLRTRASRWRAGPTPPAEAALASRRVSVHLGPGRVRPAVLRVRVWR